MIRRFDDWDRAAEFVRPLAVNICRSYPGVDREDVAQVLYEWFVKNPKKAREYLSDEDVRRGERKLSASLLNRGRAFARQERASQLGYDVSDLHYYSVAEIEDLLPQVYDVEAWKSPPKGGNGGGRSRKDPALGNDHLSALADVADGIRRLDARTRGLIGLVYGDHYTQRVAAATLGLSEATVSQDLARAPKKIQRLLGGPRGGLDFDEPPELIRRVRSNASAQAETHGGYDSE